jgi:multidrug efflux system membrane fusion protein
VVACDADNARALSAGNLLLVDNTIDQSTATIRLKAIFQNEDDRLWPGQFVDARVLLATRSSVVVIPPAAMQRGPNGVFTWVVTERQTVEPHQIEVASATKEMAIVASGLQAGELVVTGGQYKLKRDAQLTATAPLTANAGH